MAVARMAARLLALSSLQAGLVCASGLDELGAVSSGSVRLILVRHGQAYSNLDPAPPLPPDQLDRLTDLGHAQSRQAAMVLRGRGPSVVLSSPASRARETAQEIGTLLNAPVQVEPRLRPLDLGRSPSGKPLDWDQRIAEWKAGRDPVPSGGESLEQLGQRVAGLVTSLQRDHAGKTVVLVAHSEVIGAYVGLLQGKPGARSWSRTDRSPS